MGVENRLLTSQLNQAAKDKSVLNENLSSLSMRMNDETKNKNSITTQFNSLVESQVLLKSKLESKNCQTSDLLEKLKVCKLFILNRSEIDCLLCLRLTNLLCSKNGQNIFDNATDLLSQLLRIHSYKSIVEETRPEIRIYYLLQACSSI